MSVSTEEARAIVHAALQAIDDGNPDARRAIWRAKVKTAQCARFVGGQAIQLHGGMGMTDELVVGHYYKRLDHVRDAARRRRVVSEAVGRRRNRLKRAGARSFSTRYTRRKQKREDAP